MGQKLFRDPLYDYISIDLDKYSWLLELVNCPEVQRLRFINHLGLSQVTYPGATHSRFSHALGVLHLMQQCLTYLKTDPVVHFEEGEEDALLAASLLHDIGHGPFSHVTEGFFGDHETKGLEIIQSENSGVNKILSKVNKDLPLKVAALIVTKKLPKNAAPPKLWQRSLISSPLDMDRLDYLRRDSLFSGAEYGNFDWYRIIHTMQLKKEPKSNDVWVVWPNKSKFAIEEYIFSRFYMYQSVYFHHTSRGFECLLKKILECARDTAKEDKKFAESLLPQMQVITNEKTPLEDFHHLTDYIVLSQIAAWQGSKHPTISDLSKRFLTRSGLGWKEPTEQLRMTKEAAGKIAKICQYLDEKGLDSKCYFFDDETRAALYRPYVPFGIDELTPVTSIILYDPSYGETRFCEISDARGLERLKAIFKDAEAAATVRYYFPKEHQQQIVKILEEAS